MARRRSLAGPLGLVALIAVIAAAGYFGRGVLAGYGWAFLPGIFGLAIVARVVDELARRRRLRDFRDR